MAQSVPEQDIDLGPSMFLGGILRGNIIGATHEWSALPDPEEAFMIGDVTYEARVGDIAKSTTAMWYCDDPFGYKQWFRFSIAFDDGIVHYATQVCEVTCGINVQIPEISRFLTRSVEFVHAAQAGSVPMPRRSWVPYKSSPSGATDSFRYYDIYTWFYPYQWILLHLQLEDFE